MDARWRPLRGRRIVSFGWVVSGPLVGRYLIDLGAEVIKVESVTRPDNLRLRGAMKGGAIDWSVANNVPLFHAINRGARSFAVDMKRPEGLDLLKALIARSDAVVENFTVGALERAGLGDDVLRELNPRLVRISLTPAGRSGPLACLRAYAATTSSLAGLENAVGYPGGPDRPVGMLTFGAADYAAGALAAFTLVAALGARERRFRSIDASQLAATVIGLGGAFAAHAAGFPPRPGNGGYLQAPEGAYRAADGGYVALAVRTDDEWARAAPLFRLDDPSLRTGAERVARRREIDAAVARWVSARRREDAVAALRACGLRAAPVLDMEGRRRDPDVAERSSLETIELRDGRAVAVPRAPWRVDGGTPVGPPRAPDLGEDTAYVCREILGLSAERSDALARDGVIFTSAPPVAAG